KEAETVREGLEKLTDRLVEPEADKHMQQPAIHPDAFDADAAAEDTSGLPSESTESIETVTTAENIGAAEETDQAVEAKQRQATEKAENVTKNSAKKSKNKQ